MQNSNSNAGTNVLAITNADVTTSSQTIAKPNVNRCPFCKSKKTMDISQYKSNGVFGSGHSSFKTFDALCCQECGIMFRDVSNIG